MDYLLKYRFLIYIVHRDYYQSVFGYWQYHVLGIKIVLCEPLASIIHYFLFPIHDTADTQRHKGNNLYHIISSLIQPVLRNVTCCQNNNKWAPLLIQRCGYHEGVAWQRDITLSS